jgi:long-chain acyl-CoA synthetase
MTAAGKRVAPQRIERLLTSHRLISQAVLHGDRRPFCSALITLDPEALKELAVANGWGERSFAELTQRPEAYRAVREAVARVNARLASHETIEKFKILEHDFSPESGELTPTGKVKRNAVTERYQPTLDSFYAERRP